MNKATTDAIDEIIARESEATRPMEDGEFTARQYMERATESGQSLAYITACRRLERMAESGILEKRVGLVDSKHTNIYKPKKREQRAKKK